MGMWNWLQSSLLVLFCSGCGSKDSLTGHWIGQYIREDSGGFNEGYYPLTIELVESEGQLSGTASLEVWGDNWEGAVLGTLQEEAVTFSCDCQSGETTYLMEFEGIYRGNSLEGDLIWNLSDITWQGDFELVKLN